MSKRRIKCEDFVKEQVFRSLFDSEEETIEYCQRFQNIDELWTPFHIAQFSSLLDTIKETYAEVNDHLRVLLDANRVIMMASVIELLNSREKHLPFNKWVAQQGKNQEVPIRVIKLWDDYIKIHGSAEKFRTFFVKYLTKDEKFELMKSVQFWKREQKTFLPLFCFKGKECNVSHGYCEFDINKEKCPSYASEKKMQRGIRECANFLYSLRNRFVHEARLINFPEPLPGGVGGSSWLYDYVEYRFLSGRYFQGTIKMDLFSERLVKLGRKYLKQLMQDYLEAAEKRVGT